MAAVKKIPISVSVFGDRFWWRLEIRHRTLGQLSYTTTNHPAGTSSTKDKPILGERSAFRAAAQLERYYPHFEVLRALPPDYDRDELKHKLRRKDV